MSALPAWLWLEIKTTRREYFVLDQRDLAGVLPDGHIVALVTPRRLGGPRWIVVPATRLAPGTIQPDELVALAVETELADGLQRGWSDWLLDADVRKRLAQGGAGGLRQRVRWCRSEHPPRTHKGTPSVREVRVDAALTELRAELEHGLAGGSQVEGQLHQILIEDALAQLGYEILPNPIGVPDVRARLVGAAGGDVQRALAEWSPKTPGLRAVREALLALRPDELSELGELGKLGELRELWGSGAPREPGGQRPPK